MESGLARYCDWLLGVSPHRPQARAAAGHADLPGHPEAEARVVGHVLLLGRLQVRPEAPVVTAGQPGVQQRRPEPVTLGERVGAQDRQVPVRFDRMRALDLAQPAQDGERPGAQDPYEAGKLAELGGDRDPPASRRIPQGAGHDLAVLLGQLADAVRQVRVAEQGGEHGAHPLRVPGEHPLPDRVVLEGTTEDRGEGGGVGGRDVTYRVHESSSVGGATGRAVFVDSLAPLTHAVSVSCDDRYVKILIRVVSTAIALWVATLVVSGLELTTASTPRKVGTLIVVAVVFGLINAFLKPIIKTFGCAFYILTLGLFAFVVNGLLLWLASWAADKMNLPFLVSGFWAAFWGASVVGVVGWLL